MKKVKMFVVAALLIGIGQVASAQHAGHSPDARKSGQNDPPMTSDQLRIAVQKICPVSGQRLGSMGDPVKAKFGQEEVFLCCDGCQNGKVNKDHWATIHANIAKSQAKCPVMNTPLPKDPKSTIVEGRIVYICCPPCAKKIAADPKTHLGTVDALYAASLKAKPSAP